MRKSLWTILIVLLAIILIGGGIWYFYTSYQPKGDITNGWWNPEAQQCWLSPDHPPGESHPVDGDEAMFASCCFNADGEQVDCNNPENVLGPGTSQAIYGVGGEPGMPNIWYVAHVFTVTNDGSVPIDLAWINSADWTPSHSELTIAYAPIIGEASSYAGPIPIGHYITFPTGTLEHPLIILNEIAGPPGSPATYDIDMIIMATAYEGELDSSREVSGQITVEEEEIGFSVDINWGA